MDTIFPTAGRTQRFVIPFVCNKHIQYTAIFTAVEITIFSRKTSTFFLIFARNMDCEAVLTSGHILCFRAK